MHQIELREGKEYLMDGKIFTWARKEGGGYMINLADHAYKEDQDHRHTGSRGDSVSIPDNRKWKTVDNVENLRRGNIIRKIGGKTEYKLLYGFFDSKAPASITVTLDITNPGEWEVLN